MDGVPMHLPMDAIRASLSIVPDGGMKPPYRVTNKDTLWDGIIRAAKEEWNGVDVSNPFTLLSLRLDGIII